MANKEKEIAVNAYGEEIYLPAAAEHMDDDIREAVNLALAPCSAQEFWDEYCKRHHEKHGEEFFLNLKNPVW